MNTDERGVELQSRMAIIRGKQQRRIAEVQNESERLIDWREHVKAAPLTALSISAIVGFLIVQNRPQSRAFSAPSHGEVQPVASVASTQRTNPLVGMAVSILSNVAMNAGKRFVTQQLRSLIKDNQHDSTSEPRTIHRTQRFST